MPRPQITLDAAKVEEYLHLGSPVAEIADYLGVSESTLRRKFRVLIRKSRANRRIHLREFQWQQAERGSVPMLIFLGKLELGQGDDAAGRDDRIIIRRVVDRSGPKLLPGPT